MALRIMTYNVLDGGQGREHFNIQLWRNFDFEAAGSVRQRGQRKRPASAGHLDGRYRTRTYDLCDVNATL